jgi:hypothetical protein
MGRYIDGRKALAAKISAAFNIIPDATGISIDKVMKVAARNKIKYACVLSFAGGNRAATEALQVGSNRGRTWIWSVYCTLLARYEGDAEEIENETEEAIEVLKGLFDDDPRLGGTVDYAKITSIDIPEEVYISDQPWKLISFAVEFWDKA